MKLIVREPFGNYAVGQEIENPHAVKALLKSHPNHVIRLAKAKPVTEGPKSGTN